MSAFAGFWVDGAVRKPEVQHIDKEGCVIGKWKNDLDADFDLLLRRFNRWHEVYWLDTTPRESLTPEELLSVVKVIWPNIATVLKLNSHQWYIADESTNALIDWGNLTQYPPPAQPQWIRITRENVGQYLFLECRLRDGSNEDWRNGRVVGWCIEDECCLVDSDFHPTERILSWNFVEVQNAS